MKHYLKILFFFTLPIMISCCVNDDVDCTNALPAPDWFELGFFDSQGQPLIGSVYQQNEFRVFNSNTETLISSMPFGDSTRLQVRFPDFTTNTQYYIELTSVDIDTLNFIFETTRGPCFLRYELMQVIYNGATIEVQNRDRVDLMK
ncbi:MAG: hypothetical protein KJN85_07935 [Maribacter sp.]|nr:hypothetical protein [Maribacter sp.]MBT8315494.1 hypothetical protein [Maribacter sp.]